MLILLIFTHIHTLKNDPICSMEYFGKEFWSFSTKSRPHRNFEIDHVPYQESHTQCLHMYCQYDDELNQCTYRRIPNTGGYFVRDRVRYTRIAGYLRVRDASGELLDDGADVCICDCGYCSTSVWICCRTWIRGGCVDARGCPMSSRSGITCEGVLRKHVG